MSANTVLKRLLSDVLKAGKDVPSRAGNTKELTFVNFTVADPQDRYITLPYRNVSVPAQIAETMWVLGGRNDVEWLSAYLPQAPKFADDGKHWRAGYGPRIRSWGEGGIDQLQNVIDLLKKDPTTRRAVISLWDPEVDVTTDTLDVPCNNWLHFLARDGVLDLNVSIRSNDLMWGWSGINFFEWSVLLEIVARYTNLKVGGLHFNVSSLHLYDRHFEKAKRIVSAPQVTQAARALLHGAGQRVVFSGGPKGNKTPDNLDMLIEQWFAIEKEIRGGDISSIDKMPDPLLQSWLWAIAYYWGREEIALVRLDDRDIVEALTLSPKRKKSPEEQNLPLLVSMMCRLHTEKSAAYGNSWKKRGEVFSILPNIARKVDRIIANTETSDETKLDTAMDLVIYLAKYRHWLHLGDKATVESENTTLSNILTTYPRAQGDLNFWFEDLLTNVQANSDRREALERVISISVNHLMELWNGPEGRAYRNESRSWNPE